MPDIRRHLSTWFLAALIVGVVAVVLWQSADARQVAHEAMTLVFTFFTTPFILEPTVAIVGLMTVLVINQRRQDREQDEWVEMEVPAKPAPAAEAPKSQGQV